jgi:hypothetical protein
MVEIDTEKSKRKTLRGTTGMQQIPSWIAHHWQLVATFALIVILLAAGGVFYAVTHMTPQPAGKNCGSVTSLGNLYSLSDSGGMVPEIASCFSQAYQQCQPAYMQVTHMGVDAGTDETFFISEQQNRCTILDKSASYNVMIGSNLNPRTETCAGLMLTKDTLTIVNCGQDGNSFVPLAQQCGSVQTANFANAKDFAKQQANVENCFWQASQHCYVASMSYEGTTDVDSGRRFNIDASCSISEHSYTGTSSSSSPTYTCTGVTQRPDGLHFAGCGKDGDILVPLSS